MFCGISSVESKVPLVMSEKSVHEKSRLPRRFLLYILCVGLLFSAYLFLLVQEWEQQQAQHDFEIASYSYVAAVQNELARHNEVLSSIASIYGTSDKIDRTAFAAFVSAISLEHRDTTSFEWAPRVLHTERAAYEARARLLGDLSFNVTELDDDGRLVSASQREFYFPIAQIEPHERSGRPLGLDLAAEPVRRKALLLARDSGKTMISGRIQLDHDGGTGHGFLMIRPVYQHGVVPESVEARRQQLKGFLLGENNLNVFFGEALFDSAYESLSLWVYEQSAPGSKVLLFSRDIYERNAADISSAGWLLSGHDMEWKVNTEQYGRHWTFMFKPTALFMQTMISWRSWLVLVSGIMMTLLVLFFVYRGQRYTAMIERKAMLLAQEKDESELRYLRLFESNNDALFVFEIDEEHGPGKFKDINKAMCQRLGYSKEELLQMSPMDINLPEAKKELQTSLEKVLQHKVHLFDTVHMTKGGREIPVEINIQVLDGFNERMFIGCARDIAERRKAHEKQIEAKEWEMAKLSSAVDQTADSIMITDRNGIIEYVNPSFEGITGYSRDEAQGKTPSIFKSGHNTSDDYKQLWQAILNGEVYRNVLV